VHNQESNALAATAEAEGLAIVPDGDGVRDGGTVTVMLL
jgi:molybdopterin biosynthesis enzyme